jgi:hypothetical protein
MPTRTSPTRDRADAPGHLDRVRELIPRHTRSGLLRRVTLPDGGVEFVEAMTDRVFAAFDGRGRLLA